MHSFVAIYNLSFTMLYFVKSWVYYLTLVLLLGDMIPTELDKLNYL